MRHYHREEQRRLNDSERFRDPEYLADDGWVGPNEHVVEATPTPRTAAAGESREPAARARPAPEAAPSRVRRAQRTVAGRIARTIDKVLGAMSHRRELRRLRAILLRRRSTRVLWRMLERRRRAAAP